MQYKTLKIEGSLGIKYGERHNVKVNTPVDALRVVDANKEGFLLELSNHELNYMMTIDGEELTEDTLLEVPMSKPFSEITIKPIPQGAKGGAGKLLAGVAMVGLVLATGGTAGAFWSVGANTFGISLGQVVVGIGISLAMTGIQQMMAPDPATDTSPEGTDDNYLFSGRLTTGYDNNPVPVLYGRLKVRGVPMYYDIVNGDFSGLTE